MAAGQEGEHSGAIGAHEVERFGRGLYILGRLVCASGSFSTVVILGTRCFSDRGRCNT
jgi:hypothetical protein